MIFLRNRISNNIDEMQKNMGESYWNISASGIAFRSIFNNYLEKYSEGRLLDVGAGNLLYKHLLEKYCSSYESLDVKEDAKLDYVQDIQDTNLSSSVFDTVFCRNVLEHVEKPREALTEISRILKQDGIAIISVPHLAYLHNEPEDYYRFTKYGVEEISSQTDLEIIEVEEAGGLFSFLGYVFSTVFMGLTYDVAILSWFTYRINYIIQHGCVMIDNLSGTDIYMPLNYVFVLKNSS
ncbi:MAG: class I SAM-dependent methyltransferase [Candidatus Nanosalina sp.]